MPLLLSEFADEINRILPAVMSEFVKRYASGLNKVKVTLPQFFILNFLDEKGEAKMSELASIMQVTTAAMTGVVDRIVKYGYVKRVYDPEDRRIIKVRLTPKGKELVNKVNLQRKQMLISIFGKLSEKDRQDYLRVLRSIKDVLTKEEKVIVQ